MKRWWMVVLIGLAFALGYAASGFEPGAGVGCPIYAVRISPRDPNKVEKWLTPAQWNIYETPHGDVLVGWDNTNDVLRIIGSDLQSMRVVGNVIDIEVVEDEEMP